MTPARAPSWRTIGELAGELAVSTRTLRYYESLGLLGRVHRRGGGRRAYGDEQVARVRFIQKLKLLGLSLQEIAELADVHAQSSTAGMLERLLPKLDRRLSELDERLRLLETLRQEIQAYRSRMARRLEALR
jgi:DNA-binding transcriptional MerR regulator